MSEKGGGGTPQIRNLFFGEIFFPERGGYPPYGQNPHSSIWPPPLRTDGNIPLGNPLDVWLIDRLVWMKLYVFISCTNMCIYMSSYVFWGQPILSRCHNLIPYLCFCFCIYICASFCICSCVCLLNSYMYYQSEARSQFANLAVITLRLPPSASFPHLVNRTPLQSSSVDPLTVTERISNPGDTLPLTSIWPAPAAFINHLRLGDGHQKGKLGPIWIPKIEAAWAGGDLFGQTTGCAMHTQVGPMHTHHVSSNKLGYPSDLCHIYFRH